MVAAENGLSPRVPVAENDSSPVREKERIVIGLSLNGKKENRIPNLRLLERLLRILPVNLIGN